MLPRKLCCELEKYTQKQKTVSDEIFLTRNRKGLSRRQIWMELKASQAKAGGGDQGAPPQPVPHRCHGVYQTYRDVAKLADVLGAALWKPPAFFQSPPVRNVPGRWRKWTAPIKYHNITKFLY